MIFVLLTAAFTGILTFALQLLPGSDFLALPEALYVAVRSASGVGGWILGLAGTDVKNQLLVILPIFLGIKVAVMLWDILRFWRPPFTRKLV